MPRASFFLLLCLVATSTLIQADVTRPVTLPDRARGAQRVVVATVVGSAAEFQRNSYGDELIVSRLTLRVEESLKGTPSQNAAVEIEGGTVGGLTLRVSDLPAMAKGDRAVFFLDAKADAPGVDVPHLRGQGILPLDASNRVTGSSLTLDQVRAAVRAAAGR